MIYLFDPTSGFHILETNVNPSSHEIALSQAQLARKMELQYFDSLEDNNDDSWDFIPTGVVAHRISLTPRHTLDHDRSFHLTKTRHVRVKTVWRNGEVSWVAADALKEQNPWILVNCTMNDKLTGYPDFSWTLDYIKNKQVVANTSKLQALAAKTQGDTRFKFGVQVPKTES